MEQGGRFVLEDPRTAFYYPDDPQIIVSFEWEGRRGPHHFEGRWKNPSGKVVMVSEFAYESPGQRFGAYWTLTLNDGVTPGLWALEALVDGVPAGMHAFQILESADASLTQAGPALLTPSQLYARLQESTVTVDRIDADGQKVASASGFLLPEGRLLTTFSVVEGASRLRVSLFDGRSAELEHLLAWDRRGEWALFVHGLDADPLSVASGDVEAIGDRCYSLDSPFEGSRVLAEGQVVGQQSFPEIGERLTVSFSLTTFAYGSPVVNGYGEVIGLAVHPETWPGAATLDALRLNRPYGLPFSQSSVGMVTPLGRVEIDTTAEPVALTSLLEGGEFLQSLVESAHIGRALLLREVDEDQLADGMTPFEGEFEFSRSKGDLKVLVYWNPLDKLETDYRLEIYDLDNRRLFEGQTRHLKLKAYTRTHTIWSLSVGMLPPAIYRVDLLLDSQAVWRSFFKLVD